MNNAEFMDMYSEYISHKWVTSKDKQKAAQQKAQEKAYNRRYYQEHKDELLDKARQGLGRPNNSEFGRLLTRDEALVDLNKRQEDLATYYKFNPDASVSDQIEINKLVSQGMSKEEAKKKVSRERLAVLYDDMKKEQWNKNASKTSKAKAEEMRNAVNAKKQQKTLSRVSERDTKASKAQMDASVQRRKNFTSTESRIKRSIDKSVKKVAKSANSVKAATQNAKDFYKNTTASANRIIDFTKNTINKYFG